MKPRLGQFLVLLFLLSISVCTSCKNDRESNNNPRVQIDPELSDKDIDVLDSASIDIEPFLDIKDFNGISYRQIFADPNWRKRLDTLETPGRLSSISINMQIKKDLEKILLDGFGLWYENQAESSVLPRESEELPRQQKYAYVQVISPLVKQIGYRQFPNVNNNSLYTSKGLQGIDCSGYLGLLLVKNGFTDFNLANVYTGNFIYSANKAVKSKYSDKAELVKVPNNLKKAGDFILWNSHIAMIGDDSDLNPVCLQSNGTNDPKDRYKNGKLTRTSEQDHKINYEYPANGILRRGINGKDLSVLLSNDFNLGIWTLHRIVPIIDKAEKKLGDNQQGQENQKLAQPLKVKVLDKDGFGIPDVTVEFTVTGGGGNVSAASAETNEDGSASVDWTLGTQGAGNQKVGVKIKKFDGQYLTDQNIVFTATFSTCPSTVTDIDGNVYNTVSIGTQCWIKENLRTSKYSNGDQIPTGLSDSQWENTNSGACDINPANIIEYGKFYNWYAVVDLRGLCPAGWHVPTVHDWNLLIRYLDPVSDTTIVNNTGNTAGSQMGSTSGFAGLPTGHRVPGGYCCGDAFWWSSNDHNGGPGWNFNRSQQSLMQDFEYKTAGFSVRCIRD